MQPARLVFLGVALVLFSDGASAGEPPAANLTTLRTANPPLRAATTPIIAVPAPGNVPVIAWPETAKARPDQLAAALAEKGQLATELAAARKEAEQLQAQLAQNSGTTNVLARAQKVIRDTQASLARQSGELATARAETAAAHLEIGKGQTQLNAIREQLAASGDARTKAEIALSAAEQVVVARAEDLAKLRASVTAQELATLRQRTSAHELDARVKQLETEKATLAAAAASASANTEEFARTAKALAEAEGKLATSLRSYTTLTTERDELRGQLTDLTGKLTAAIEARTVAVAAAATADARTAAAIEASAAAIAAVAATEARAAAAAVLVGATTTPPPVVVGTPTRPTAPASPDDRTHVIAVGDTLASLSRRYYGTANRWPDILAANRDVLPNERSLVAGKTLRIP